MYKSQITQNCTLPNGITLNKNINTPILMDTLSVTIMDKRRMAITPLLTFVYSGTLNTDRSFA